MALSSQSDRSGQKQLLEIDADNNDDKDVDVVELAQAKVDEKADADDCSIPDVTNAYFVPDLVSHVFSAAIFNKKKLSWREKIYHFMHTPLMQTIIVVFVILDCLVVFAQLYVDLQEEKEKYAQLELECYENDTEAVEAKEKSIHAYEIAYEVLHYTSIALISLFFVEVCVKMITGWHHFVRSILEIADACIVIISFGLDILLTVEEVSVAVESIAQLLILLRLWRIARIVNGAAVAMDTKWRTKYDALHDKYKLLKDEVHGSSDSPATDKRHHSHQH